MKEYDTFVDSSNQGIIEEAMVKGLEVPLLVRDRETLRSMAVKALLAKPPKRLEGAEKLWVMTPLGVLRGEEAWDIKIVEELDEEELGKEEFHRCDLHGKAKL